MGRSGLNWGKGETALASSLPPAPLVAERKYDATSSALCDVQNVSQPLIINC